MTHEVPPIVKRTEQLLRDVEESVSRWTRRHRYALGQDLRAQAREATRLVHRAWRDRDNAFLWVTDLVWIVDEIKVSLQMAAMLRAASSFRQFEALGVVAADVGRQAQGWKSKLQHRNGQNGVGHARHQRAKTLSTCAASAGANS